MIKNKRLTKTTPPKSGPNSQVPPVKLNMGGDACCSECVDVRGTKSIQVKGFNFRGVRWYLRKLQDGFGVYFFH